MKKIIKQWLGLDEKVEDDENIVNNSLTSHASIPKFSRSTSQPISTYSTSGVIGASGSIGPSGIAGASGYSGISGIHGSSMTYVPITSTTSTSGGWGSISISGVYNAFMLTQLEFGFTIKFKSEVSALQVSWREKTFKPTKNKRLI